MNWPALLCGCCLLFLAFSIAVAFGWWGLLGAIPLAMWSMAMINAAAIRRGRADR